MDYTEKLESIQKRYAATQQQIAELQKELLRLEGEFRAFSTLQQEAEAAEDQDEDDTDASGETEEPSNVILLEQDEPPEATGTE